MEPFHFESSQGADGVMGRMGERGDEGSEVSCFKNNCGIQVYSF